jgi:Lysozyme like domain
MPARINGFSLAYTAVGGIVLWSGIQGTTLTSTFRGLLSGEAPTANQEPITAPASTGDTGGGSTSGDTVKAGQKTISPAEAYQALITAGLSPSVALILTAVGGAESTWNLDAVNNDPGTGDYSIGVWQINYYGDLLQSRTAQFGSPAELLGNLPAQASAAAEIYHEQGLKAWTTYTSGAFSAYLLQAQHAANTP